jgi:hypothetical protein
LIFYPRIDVPGESLDLDILDRMMVKLSVLFSLVGGIVLEEVLARGV